MLQMRYSLLLIVLAATAGWVSGARILAVLPFPSRSHHNMFQAILSTLAARGHQVVNYSPFTLDKPMANYTDIRLDPMSAQKSIPKELFMKIMNMSPVGAFSILWPQAEQMQAIFKNEKIKELLSSDEKFDLVILEAFYAQESFLGFGYKFNAPVINLLPFGSLGALNKVAGNSLSLAHIPDFCFYSSDKMSFYERLLNSYSILSALYLYYVKYLPTQEEFMRTIFKDPKMSSVVDMLHNISLHVNNAHPNVHYAQPYTPNIIPLGGIHLLETMKPLPQDMKRFLDEANQGVVYVSLGSLIPDDFLSQEFFDNFINVFRRLPQRVLWKTKVDHPGLPDNVMTAKWMPQQEILAHPNVVLFMTHGGLFSQQEAINAGVPVVCIPFFGDQQLNAKFYEERKIGVKLPFDTLAEDTIYSALTTVLNNPRYTENMKRLSAIYRDRPVSASDSLVFWVEYVLRHRGAHHLRPASAGLSWYQLALLDVLAVVLAALLVLATLFYLVLTRVLRLIRTHLHSDTATSSKKTN